VQYQPRHRNYVGEPDVNAQKKRVNEAISMNDNRTLQQILHDLIEKDGNQQLEINELKNMVKMLKDRIMILYKEVKKVGIETDLLD